MKLKKKSIKKTKTPSQLELIGQTHDLDKKIGINLQKVNKKNET